MKKQEKTLHPADLITGIRILCGILILFVPAFSGWFYVLYLLGGLSDAIDGMVARKLGQASDFGAKLDTIADFIFAIAVFVKIAGVVLVTAWLMVWAVLIIVIKIMNVIACLLATAAAIAESIVIMNQKGGHCHAQKRQRSYGNE